MIIYTGMNKISQDEVQAVFDEVNRCFKEYKVVPINMTVHISVALKKANGTCHIYWNKDKEITSSKIVLNVEVFKQKGLERVLETIRHEVAHYIAFTKTRKLDHCETFKKICVSLGGTMNLQLAGTTYAASAAPSSHFVKHKTNYKYKLTCKCGVSVKKVRKPTIKTLLTHVCKTCRTQLRFWKIENI